MIACFLGRETALCRQELLLRFPHLDFTPLVDGNESIVVLPAEKISPEEVIRLQNELGGVVKIAELSPTPIPLEALEETLFAKLMSTSSDRKFPFGLSCYDVGAAKLARELLKRRTDIGQSLKRQAKAAEKNVRYVDSREPILNAVALDTEHILERGKEWVCLATPDGLLLGETITAQDFRSWSKRDFGRPSRDASSGMLPPKLARTLVNLALSHQPTQTLWDPFCGSGTVLMEAGLLGIPTLIGTDLSEKAIEDSLANLEWMEEHHLFSPTIPTTTLFVADATKERPSVAPDAIVFEGFLGPRHLPRDLEPLVLELEAFYTDVLHHLASCLVPGGVMVAALPVFVTDEAQFFLSLQDALKEAGLETTWHPSLSQEELTHNGGLLYGREDQRVWREILRVEKRS